jgi:poly(ADP-ribose) glycohydrolase ARH3
MFDLAQLRDRFRGALIGSALGDALGAPTTALAHPAGLGVALAQHDDLPFTRYTGDTVLTLGLAEAMLAHQHVDSVHVRSIWAQRYHAEPWRDYRVDLVPLLQQWEAGDFDEAAIIAERAGTAYGNGAAVRSTPVAMLAFSDIEAALALARGQAQITHPHKLDVEGAVLYAAAIALLLRTSDSQPLDRADFLAALSQLIDEPTYQRRLALIYRLGADATPAELAEWLGTSLAAHESVPTAIACFLRTPHSFPATLTTTLHLGGAVGPIAMMAGALSGAYLGAVAVPERWCTQLEHAEQICDLADQVLIAALSYQPMQRRTAA